MELIDNWPIVTKASIEDLLNLFNQSDDFNFNQKLSAYSFNYSHGTVIADIYDKPQSFVLYFPEASKEEKMHYNIIMSDYSTTIKLHPYLSPGDKYYPGKKMEGVSKQKAMAFVIKDIVMMLDGKKIEYCFLESYHNIMEEPFNIVYGPEYKK